MEKAMVPICKKDLVYRPLEMPLEPMEFLTYSRSQSFNTFESSVSTLQNRRRTHLRQRWYSREENDEGIPFGFEHLWILRFSCPKQREEPISGQPSASNIDELAIQAK